MAYKFDTAKILLVDDIIPMLTLTKSILSLFGFKNVTTAADGEQAYQIFRRLNPDLVITDWMMEPKDGLWLVDKIRQDPLSPNKYIPIIVMSGYSSRFKVEKARDLGITEFLVKPFTAKDLYSRIEHVIEKPRRFVDCERFFGPDRRRRNNEEYKGPRRRDDDDDAFGITLPEEEDSSTAETLNRLVTETRDRTR